MDAQFVLPYPPSVNRYWRSVHGRVLISRDGRTYRTNVRTFVLQNRITMITDLVAVTIVANPPDRRRRDLDNILKATLDAMQHGGILEDDVQVKELHLSWGEVVRGGSLEVKIETLEMESATNG